MNVGRLPWLFHDEDRAPITVVERVYDAVAINVFGDEITGEGFGDFDYTSTKSGGAKKGLIEVLTAAMARTEEPRQRPMFVPIGGAMPGMPGVPSVAGPPSARIGMYYEVLKNAAAQSVGYRLIAVSHSPDFRFGDSVETLLTSNESDAQED